MQPDKAFASLARALGTAFKESPGEPWHDDVFEPWAHRVFAYQFETNPVYAAYVLKRGVTPSTVAHWSEIPWVPASAFKAVPLVSGDASRVQRVFRTSGTTGAGRRGEHHVLDLGLYEDSLMPNISSTRRKPPPGAVERKATVASVCDRDRAGPARPVSRDDSGPLRAERGSRRANEAERIVATTGENGLLRACASRKRRRRLEKGSSNRDDGTREAAKAAHLLDVGVVIPMHYGTFPALTGTPEALREAIGSLPINVVELEPGGSLE